MDNLSNDAKFLLSSMQAEYLKGRKEKIFRETARNFHNIDYFKQNSMQEWSEDDILDTRFELKKYEYITGQQLVILFTLYT